MTAEILSIIALCLSALSAVFAAVFPAVLNYRVKQAELRAQKERDDKQLKAQKERDEMQLKSQLEREDKQKYEAKFEEFYQAHLKVVNDFANLYEQWKLDSQKNNELLNFINKIAPEFRHSINAWLYEFADKVKNYKLGDDLDADYKRCRQLILGSYGVRVSAETPNYFMTDIIRIALREQFDKLQNATSKDLNFHTF